MKRAPGRRTSFLGRTGLRTLHTLATAGMLALLSACQADRAGGRLALQVDAQDAVSALQRINEAGSACWMRSSDPAFRGLSLVPELDTTAGRPRLLLLERNKAAGLPSLVIEAAGMPVTIETYGPLADTSTGARVKADIRRWSGGRLTCRG